MTLTRKTAIVTGSTTGVGAAAATSRAKGAEVIMFQGDAGNDAAGRAMANAALTEWGRMVSSIGGVTGIASSIAYVSSKAALNLMTQSLAITLGPEIRVNAVCPGMIQTRWLKVDLDDERYEATVKVGTQLSPPQEGIHGRGSGGNRGLVPGGRTGGHGTGPDQRYRRPSRPAPTHEHGQEELMGYRPPFPHLIGRAGP